jgi:hypothetical protein
MVQYYTQHVYAIAYAGNLHGKHDNEINRAQYMQASVSWHDNIGSCVMQVFDTAQITIVFSKKGQLAERYAIKHGLWLRPIGRRYSLCRQKLFRNFAALKQRYASHHKVAATFFGIMRLV